MSEPFKPSIIIIGAGPSGLLLTHLLTTLPVPPIKVLLLDSAPSLSTAPRATHYGPSAMTVLRRAGLVPKMLELGFEPDTVCWRKLSGEKIAGLGFGKEGAGTEKIVCLPLNKLGGIMMGELAAAVEKGLAKIEWGRKVVKVGEVEGEGKAWVDVEVPAGGESEEGEKKLERLYADYVVGCDGANSIVRRSLFGKGDEGFPGKTWDEQIVATNTYYTFPPTWEDSNFIIHPEHWFMAARISNDKPVNMWRITYGELPNLTPSQLSERQPWKFQTMLPGNPTPDQYKITNFSPYRVHQRLAPKMRVGRIILAADAAHLCNPFGGMGLTSGISDIGGLYDCLAGIYSGEADAEYILEKYHEVRSKKYKEIIDPVSSENIVRLFGQDPEVAGEKDGFLRLCKRAEGDEGLQIEMARGAMALDHDFRQYYNRRNVGEEGGEKGVNGVGVVAAGVAGSD